MPDINLLWFRHRLLWLLACSLLPLPAGAAPAPSVPTPPVPTLEQCITESVRNADPTLTIGEIKAECELQQIQVQLPKTVPSAMNRLTMEKRTEWNPYVITAHKQNYILPYTYTPDPNSAPYVAAGEGELVNEEAKMQISFKVPLIERDLLVLGDSFYFGFTLQSFWQVYNRESSAPFRETSYQPEFFYTMPFGITREGRGAALRLGAEHQSNGQSNALSRSWNRVYTQFFYARENYLISLRPWYRLPEEKKDGPLDASGDDNPDIDDYMGYFELQAVVERRKYEYSLLLRNNLRGENHGAIELGVSFPLWGRVRGYAQYFNGYGESLIDYNYRSQRIGVGVLLTDLL